MIDRQTECQLYFLGQIDRIIDTKADRQKVRYLRIDRQKDRYTRIDEQKDRQKVRYIRIDRQKDDGKLNI